MNPLCACNCGEETSGGRFCRGHNSRNKEDREKSRLTYANHSDEVRAAIRMKKEKTAIERYGGIGYASHELAKKSNDTTLSKYGHTIAMKNPIIQEKQRKTNEERYGGPSPFCSIEIMEKARTTNFKRTGYNYSMQNPEIIKKTKLTNEERYGGPSPMCSEIVQEKSHQTCLENNGVDNPMQSKEILEKGRKTNFDRTGFFNAMQNPESLEKARRTNFERTGYRNPMQNPLILEKQQKSSFKRKEYKLPSGKIILLQGFELHFLDYVFSNNLLKEEEIVFRPDRIKYINEGEEHYYFADFFIPKWNLIIEIKSCYILSLNPKIVDLKADAVKALGYKYIMILDKKYDEFKSIIEQRIQELIPLEVS